MNQINREDMLELTRRMTLKRNCFGRIAGAYLDKDGFVDGTFNKNFRKLSAKDQQLNLDIAKTIPFSETNVNLKEYIFQKEDERPGSAWQMLMALRECELKNDALLDVFYEVIGERYHASGDYAVYFFMEAMMYHLRPVIRRVFGTLKRYSGLLYVQFVRYMKITSRENRSVDFFSRRLRTEGQISIGLKYLMQMDNVRIASC